MIQRNLTPEKKVRAVSVLSPAAPVKPMAAIFSADRALLAEAAAKFEKLAGVLDYAGREMFFDQTEYYRNEMGWPLYKRFFSAEQLMAPEQLVEVKVRCMELEKRWVVDGRRRVNIDPGYISPERLVLATGKNWIHRIYLGRGVYADLTLIYEKGNYQALPWTYPDFASDEALEANVRHPEKIHGSNKGAKNGESMIHSMTGFGRAVGKVLDRETTVEVRTVNNRFKDINVRTPKAYAVLEEKV